MLASALMMPGSRVRFPHFPPVEKSGRIGETVGHETRICHGAKPRGDFRGVVRIRGRHVRCRHSRRTYVNPVDVDYRYNFEQVNEQISYRTGADPVIVRHKDAYYLFMTLADGYWRSTNLLDWSFITPSRWPVASVVAPAAISDGDRLILMPSMTRPDPDPGVARSGERPAGFPDAPHAGAARHLVRESEGTWCAGIGRSATRAFSAGSMGSRAVQGRRRPLVSLLGILQYVSALRHRARHARGRFAAAHSLHRQAPRLDRARTRSNMAGSVSGRITRARTGRRTSRAPG